MFRCLAPQSSWRPFLQAGHVPRSTARPLISRWNELPQPEHPSELTLAALPCGSEAGPAGLSSVTCHPWLGETLVVFQAGAGVL